MKKEIDVSKYQSRNSSSQIHCDKLNINEVFSDRGYNFINEFKLFLAYFNRIPNFVHEIDIDCGKAHLWFTEKYGIEIKDCFYNKRYFNNSKTAIHDDVFYILFEDLIVDFDTNNSTVRFLFRETNSDKVNEISEGVKKFKERKQKDKPQMALLVNSRNGIETKSLNISKPKLSIDDNYNEDFKEIHQTIIKRLNKKNDKGLVLLHGKPGTGKTSYIRYLISSVKKNVIFLPPNMASEITNPSLVSILMDNPNSIFVIEDAENIIMDRNKEGASPVSTLLNITDGLLSDCLNIQIICSFNTDLSRVDNALLRKGRLIAKYEFKELEVVKTRELSKKLGYSSDLNEPMTLTDIYNQSDKEFNKPKREPIGFKVIGFNNIREAENCLE